MKKKILIILILFLIIFVSCKQKEPTLSIDQLYDEAIKDAVFAEEDEMFPLVEITKDDKNVIWNDKDQVLMCTLHSYPDSYIEGTTITTDFGECWLTSVKEFANWYSQEKDNITDYTLRSVQLLGLTPNIEYTHFSVFYVNPSDLFRPAYMPDITKQISELSLPLGVNNEYTIWFKEKTYSSYFNSYINYPWTRLGYTFDWAQDTDDYGLSEFVLKTGSEISIVKTAEIEEFYTFLETIK